MKKIILITALTSALILLLYSSLFLIASDQYAVVSRFGKVIKTIDKAGLYIKMPYPIESKFYIDKKIKMLEPKALEVYLADDENIVKNFTVSYFVLWSIENPLLYFESLRSEELAALRMENNLRSILSNNLGKYSFSSFISLNKEDIKTEEITDLISGEASKVLGAKYGIKIVKVDINRIILPEQNKNKVFERMVSERERISNRYRAEGEEEAKIIISEANKEKSILLSVAELEAQKLVAQAESEAAIIYARAYNKNPQFYRFWRNLQAFKESYSEDSTFILSSDDPLLMDGEF